jgi:hypothetical protein
MEENIKANNTDKSDENNTNAEKGVYRLMWKKIYLIQQQSLRMVKLRFL